MPSAPKVTGAEAIAAFEKAGFRHARTAGSHHILKKSGHRYTLSVPVHGARPLGTGLLKAQVEAAGLTMEEFQALL
jgi:predicted RNA binding protein YcfA (HicA-like mRNA interferase family)